MEEAYRKLHAAWAAGDRDRERSLHLLFLSWMHWADPPLVTGMSDDPAAAELWHEIFSFFGGETSPDPEFLYVAAIMAIVAPWALGDEGVWTAKARRMEARSLHLKPDGFSSAMFEGRNHYGDYFAHQSRSRSRRTEPATLPRFAVITYWTVLTLALLLSALIILAVSMLTYAPFPQIILQAAAILNPVLGLLCRPLAVRRYGLAKGSVILSAIMASVMVIWFAEAIYSYRPL